MFRKQIDSFPCVNSCENQNFSIQVVDNSDDSAFIEKTASREVLAGNKAIHFR